MAMLPALWVKRPMLGPSMVKATSPAGPDLRKPGTSIHVLLDTPDREVSPRARPQVLWRGKEPPRGELQAWSCRLSSASSSCPRPGEAAARRHAVSVTGAQKVLVLANLGWAGSGQGGSSGLTGSPGTRPPDPCGSHGRGRASGTWCWHRHS